MIEEPKYRGGLDDLFAKMEQEEFEDRMREQKKASPTEYAKLRGIYPQRVYRALREKKLVWDSCECGRRVIVIEEADELFGFIQELDKKGEDIDGE